MVAVSAGLISVGFISAALVSVALVSLGIRSLGIRSLGSRGRFSGLRDGCGRVDFEVAGARRRNIGWFGTRHGRIDGELGGAGAGRIRLGCQSRGRGHREEGCRDGDQYAVKSSTVGRTVTHRHTPLGETAPAWNSPQVSFVTASAKNAGLDRFSRWYACTQRFRRRRYMCPQDAASAIQGNSRQTDLEPATCIQVARFCHAP